MGEFLTVKTQRSPTVFLSLPVVTNMTTKVTPFFALSSQVWCYNNISLFTCFTYTAQQSHVLTDDGFIFKLYFIIALAAFLLCIQDYERYQFPCQRCQMRGEGGGGASGEFILQKSTLVSDLGLCKNSWIGNLGPYLLMHALSFLNCFILKKSLLLLHCR